MTKTLIAAALASCLPIVASAAPAVMGHGQTQAAAAVAPEASCYTNAGTDTLNAILSQDFTDAGGVYDAYDSAAADDFSVKSGKTCLATGLNVTGQYFNGSGPADSVTVTYYKSKSGKPGGVVASYSGLPPTGSPSFTLKHPKTKLKAGKYFVSPVAALAFTVGGEWGWEVQSEINGAEGQWQNPGGGFAVCPKWDTITNCIGVTGDFMFSVVGKLK
jgi:hypothetical protein